MDKIMNETYLDCLTSFGIGGAHPGGLQLTKKIVSNEKIEKSFSVLDAGCGTGQTSAYIAKRYKCNVTALDSNKVMLDKARQRFTSLSLPIQTRLGNTEGLPFESGVFDIVLSESVIAFTTIPSTISELRRVLKPTGVLLATEMVLEKSIPKEEEELLKEFYGISQLLSKEEWFLLFRNGGFNHVSAQDKFQLDESDIENASDYILSDHIDDKYLDILDEHNRLTNLYKNVLDFRVFRCC
ncbi:class I SAM-dependent methyltransferase [Virgibacillus sp. DJP39]|uniref:class I SAM-dependent methyltransferase n=1 Tax=Virgibacillus sp. DJP39 TaxID=3409790 RepID=UPI003BB58588